MISCLRRLGHELVFLGDVQQQRLGQFFGLGREALDADAIVADAGVDVGAGRGEEGQQAAEAEADRAHLAGAAGVAAHHASMVAAMSLTPASTSKALNSSKARFHSASDWSVMSMPGSIRQNRSGQMAR